MPRRAFAAIAVALGLVLSGCSSTVTMTPAAESNDPLCAEVSVRLPDAVAGQERRWTDAQATGAWGSPASVLLSCGVTPPGPTEAQCITIEGVDWIVDDSNAPRFLVTTYGRTPAVEVFIDNEVVSSNDVLDKLGPIVAVLPKDRECITTDTLDPEAG